MVLLDGHVPNIWTLGSDLGDIWSLASPYHIIIGVALGIGLALFDWFHTRFHPRPASQTISSLLSNLFWCGLYITTIHALNTLLALTIIKFIPVLIGLAPNSRSLILLPLLAAALLNLSAILWASIRSITQRDIITPQVLRAKLQRSSRLEA